MRSFSKQTFDESNPTARDALALSLAEYLAQGLARQSEFHTGVATLIAELTAVGHTLANLGQTEEIEVWCPKKGSEPGLVILFRPDRVEVEWSSQRSLGW